MAYSIKDSIILADSRDIVNAGVVTASKYVGGSLETTGDINVGGGASISGDIELGGNLNVVGIATIGDITVNGPDIGTRNINATGILTVAQSSLGIATAFDLTIYNQLKDSKGAVGAANSVLATVGNKLVWTTPSGAGLATAFAPGSTFFVAENGSDSNDGLSPSTPWASISYALSQISPATYDVLEVGAGDYTETFPLIVPNGVTIKGAGQRATLIRPTPATETNDGFRLGNACTVEDLSIGDMLKPAGVNNSYAFSFNVGTAITTRSPYVSRVTVLNRGSVQTADDPYGYNSANNYPVSAPGAAAFKIDGADVDASSLEAGFLLNEVTAFVPGNEGIFMTNGARAEVLNTFIYFATEGIRGESDTSTGLSGSGRTRLTLENPTAAVQAGNTVDYYSSSGTTILATGTVDEVSGNYVYLTNAGSGEFVVAENRTAVPVNFVNSAQISSAQARFGPTSLDVTNTNSDAVTAENTGFGFGTGDFTVEGWVYITGFSSGKYIWDMRSTAASDIKLSLEDLGGGDLGVNIGASQFLASTGSPLSINTWHHVAVSRDGTDFHLYVDGTEEDLAVNSTDLGTFGTLHIGADYTDNDGVTGFIDEFRITKGAAKYTGASYTVPTSALVADSNTSILLHFDGTNGDTSTTDDIIVFQDIRFTGGNTADRITLADYSEFGADLRCVGSAVEYGNRGVVGDGVGVTLRLISINFNHVGAGGDISNDPNLAIQANEVTETNSAEVSYVSIDHKGDFRVGESFYVDQESGSVSFNDTTTDLTSLNSLTITDGTNSSIITPVSGRFGNVQISGNQIESTTGDLNLVTAGSGSVNIQADLNVVGVISASGVNLASITNGDTSVALDDTGTDGTVRFITDGSEAGRFTNANDLEVVGSIKTGAGESVTSGFFYGDGAGLTNISADGVNLDGTDLSPRNINASGIVTVTGSADFNSDLDVAGPTNLQSTLAVGGTVSVASTAYIEELVLTNPLEIVSVTDAIIGTATVTTLDVTGEATFGGDITGDGATNILGINSVTATTFYGNGSNLTGVIGSGEGGAISGNLSVESLEVTVGASTFTGNVNFNDDIVGDGASNILGINSVTAVEYYGDGSNLTGVLSQDGGGNAELTGNLNVDTLTVAGLSTFTGLADFDGGIDVAGLAQLTDVQVSGSATVTGDLSVGGNLSLTGDITLDDISADSLVVAGISTLNGQVQATAAGVGLTVTNDAFVGGTLTANALVGDGSGLTNISADGVNLDGTDLSPRNINVTGIVTVAGTTNLVDVQVSGAATVTGDLSVGGNLNLTGDITLDDINADSLVVAGISTLNGQVQANGAGIGLTVANDAYIGGDITGVGSVTAASYYGDGSNLTGLVGSGGDGNIAGNLSVESLDVTVGPSTFAGSIGVAGSVTAATFFGDGAGLTNISADGVNLDGTDIEPRNLNVTGIATVAGNLNAGQDLIVTRNGVFGGIATAVEFDSTSDVRLKRGIKTLDNALNKLREINGVEFYWKRSGEKTIGVIAQQVEEIYPELVRGDEPLTVNYNGLIGVLIESVKELKLRVEELEDKLES